MGPKTGKYAKGETIQAMDRMYKPAMVKQRIDDALVIHRGIKEYK